MGFFNWLFGKRKEAPRPKKRKCPSCGQLNAQTFDRCVSCGKEMQPGMAALMKQAMELAEKHLLLVEHVDGEIAGARCAECKRFVYEDWGVGKKCAGCRVVWTEIRHTTRSSDTR